MLRKVFVSLSVFLVFSFFCVGSQVGAAGEPVHLRFTSMPIGSTWYVQAATIASLMRSQLPPKSTIDVLPFGGGIGANTMVGKGDAEMGLCFNVSSKWAYEGTVAYKGPIKNIRGIVGGLNKQYVGVVVRKGLEADSLRDVKAKKMPVRIYTMPPYGASFDSARLLLEAYGMSFDMIKSYGGKAEHTTFPSIIAAFKDGRGDIFIHAITAAHPSITEIAISSPVKFFSVESKEMEIMTGYGYSPSVFPKGSFKGQDSDVNLPLLGTNIVVNADMSDEVAYIIAKTVCENKKGLVKGHSAFEDFDPENAWKLSVVGLPIHHGAEKYFREKGWMK
ncbi:MAG: TAXI family TRAP transporter solute-binding subunit [Deltaproteobacteria bacterium]|nr:TAXI family TRAP transporter solute-binding subunit [Deltaproteobacteria bacterium]